MMSSRDVDPHRLWDHFLDFLTIARYLRQPLFDGFQQCLCLAQSGTRTAQDQQPDIHWGGCVLQLIEGASDADNRVTTTALSSLSIRHDGRRLTLTIARPLHGAVPRKPRIVRCVATKPLRNTRHHSAGSSFDR